MAGLSPWLAVAIRRQRASIGITQEELAFRASFHVTYISLVERAKRNLTVNALDRIAVGLGVRASALIAEAERARSRKRSS